MPNTKPSTSLITLTAAMLIVFSFSVDVFSQAVIRMRNGTILYGEVKKLEFAKLAVDTDDFGLINIDWEPVVYVKAPGPFNVKLSTGETLSGAIEVDSVNVTIIGATTRTVPRNQVGSIEDFSLGFWNQVSAGVDLGANVVRGNSQVTSISTGVNLGYATDHSEFTFKSSVITNEQTDADDTRRFSASFSADRSIVGRLRLGASVNYESDENQQLDYRIPFGLHVSYRAVELQRTRLDVVLGGGPTLEKYAGEDGTSVREGRVGFAFIGIPNGDTELDLSTYLYPGLFGFDRIRIESDFVFRIKIINDLNFNITSFYRFNNEPPQGVEESDWGVTVGLGWTY